MLSPTSGANIDTLSQDYIASLHSQLQGIQDNLSRFQLEYQAAKVSDSTITARLAELTLQIYNFSTQKDEFEKFLGSSLKDLGTYLKNSDAKIRETAGEQIRKLSDTVKTFKYIGDPTLIKGKPYEQLGALKSVSNFLNTYGQDMLARFGQSSRLYNDILNMQDLSNPAWIEVLNSKPTSWGNSGKPTEYKANGRSSVVVVRESPISYKIHEGSNDPSAVIRAQLHVTRAFANAATSVLSAAYGLDLSIGNSVDQQQAEESLRELARLNAESDLGLAFRNSNLDNLDTELETIRAGLTANRGNNSEVEKLRQKLRQLLELQIK